MAKILHMADIHLDSPLESMSAAFSAMRRQEIRDSFFKAVDFASKNGADMVLIVGDLFDNEYTARQTVRQVCDVMAEKRDIRFVIAPGNHDYITHFGYCGIEWPQNVHIFKTDAIERVDFPDIGVTVWGTAFTSSSRFDRALANLRLSGGGVNIVAIHGDIAEQSSYLPITAEDIANTGADYVALGHIHAFSDIKKAGGTFYAYPGCLEGRGFDETGDKGFIFGSVEKGMCDLRFVPFAKRRYIIEEIDVSSAQSLMDVYSMISEAASKYGGDVFLRILLTGELNPLITVLPEAAADMARGPYFAQVRDFTHPVKDVKAIAKQKNLTGMFAAKLLDRLESAGGYERKVLENALKLGLLALDGEKVYWDEDKEA